MPKTTAGKKWLKRIVFGRLVEMPAEIGPQITPVRFSEPTGQAQIDADLKSKKDDPQITRIAQSEQNQKLYRGHYIEPDRISSEEANASHKVIYCVATLDPQIPPQRNSPEQSGIPPQYDLPDLRGWQGKQTGAD